MPAECQAVLKYEKSTMRNPFMKERSKSKAIAVYRHIKAAVNDNTYLHKLFACALVFPECPDGASGESRVPCRHLCRTVLDGMDTSAWPTRLISMIKCDDLPESDDDDLPESDDAEDHLCVFKEKKRKQ